MALLALIAALAAVGLTAPAPAAAAPSCAKLVVADWYGDGRVDQIYALHCYTDAIRSLPVDVLDYSNAKEDILRALSYAKRGKPDPGNGGGGGGGGGSSTSTDGEPLGTDPTDAGPDGGNGATPGGSDTIAGGEDVDTSGPSSVPVPLLVLGGLALLLLAAGGAGYLSRRAQSRRDGPDEPAV